MNEVDAAAIASRPDRSTFATPLPRGRLPGARLPATLAAEFTERAARPAVRPIARPIAQPISGPGAGPIAGPGRQHLKNPDR